jgi:hypothetical protein
MKVKIQRLNGLSRSRLGPSGDGRRKNLRSRVRNRAARGCYGPGKLSTGKLSQLFERPGPVGDRDAVHVERH